MAVNWGEIMQDDLDDFLEEDPEELEEEYEQDPEGSCFFCGIILVILLQIYFFPTIYKGLKYIRFPVLVRAFCCLQQLSHEIEYYFTNKQTSRRGRPTI